MLFHPAVTALLLIDAISLALLLPAGGFALRLLQEWDLKSGSGRQIRLERRTYLVSTVLGFVFLGQIMALLLLVFTADALAVQFVGAMCAVGTLNVNSWGFPALYLKLAMFFLAAAWLVMNHIDQRAPDYPLIKVKYALLLLIVPVAVVAAGIQLLYFLNLKADVITSCCGSLFSDTGEEVAAELAGLPPLPTMIVFYLFMGATVASGLFYLWWRKGALLFAGLATLAFPVAIAAVIAFVSLYIYEHPHHHCPFCLLKAEYGYIGYALYLPLFIAAVLGFALGVTLPFSRASSLAPVLNEITPRLITVAAFLFGVFIVLVGWLSLSSNLVLLE